MKQIVIEGPQGEGKMPSEWLRTSFVDDDGQVFLPCGAFGNERNVFLCAAYDGVPLMQHKGHAYASSSWLAKEYPRHAQAIKSIVADILAHGVAAWQE